MDAVAHLVHRKAQIMTINLQAPELRELKPRIIVCGVGGGGCNAVNNMIASGLSGVDFLVANTDACAMALALTSPAIPGSAANF